MHLLDFVRTKLLVDDLPDNFVRLHVLRLLQERNGIKQGNVLPIHFFFFFSFRFEKKTWGWKKAVTFFTSTRVEKSHWHQALAIIRRWRLNQNSCLEWSALVWSAWLENIHTWHERNLSTSLLWQILAGSIENHSGIMICHSKDIWMSFCLLSMRAFKNRAENFDICLKRYQQNLRAKQKKNV